MAPVVVRGADRVGVVVLQGAVVPVTIASGRE